MKVLTDQAGLVGWGEATLQVNTHAVVGVVGDGRMEDFYHTSPEDPARLGDLASAAGDEGFTAVTAMAVGPAVAMGVRRSTRRPAG